MAVAAQNKSHHGNEVKTQFCTKEGCYRALKLSDYSRPVRLANNAPNNIPVRLSFVTIKGGNETECEDKIAFNVGRDMFFYNFRGSKKAPDLNQPIDRRTYKGPTPTCHDINMMTRTPTSIDLLIGFTAGQIQLMDPLQHECRKCFNDERLIEKGTVTCVKWIPGSESRFLVSYNNPNLYIYDKSFAPLLTEPQLTTIKRGSGYTIEVCKNKQDVNPICRWHVGNGGINEMAFSPDCKHLALVSQDGYLRLFDFDKQELVSTMRSYFGGLLCVAWSPDGRYIVTGGEDDLITVWSCLEERVIARGEGHRSWVNVVAFDAYTTHVSDECDGDDSDDEGYNGKQNNSNGPSTSATTSSSTSYTNNTNTTTNKLPLRNECKNIISYRVGSVGDDTQLLLWDIDEDVLKPNRIRTRSTRVPTMMSGSLNNSANNTTTATTLNGASPVNVIQPSWSSYTSNTMKISNSTKNNTKLDKVNFSDIGPTKYHTLNKLTSKHHNSVSNYSPPVVEKDDLILGSKICPRMSETETLEPLVAKKISYDRISALVFREDCIVTGTYEGYINVWARPEEEIPNDGSTLIQ